MSEPLHSERLDLGDNQIHIVSKFPADFEVWLNTEVTDFDGLCIGCGSTRDEAVAHALELLEDGVKALRNTGAVSPTTSAAGGE